MPTRYLCVALVSLAFVVGCNRETTPSSAKQNSNADSSTRGNGQSELSAPVRSETGNDKEKPTADPKEESLVHYDSKTNGALQVMTLTKDSGCWFDVVQDGKRPFPNAPPLLNNTLELAPGAYVVSVNPL